MILARTAETEVQTGDIETVRIVIAKEETVPLAGIAEAPTVAMIDGEVQTGREEAQRDEGTVAPRGNAARDEIEALGEDARKTARITSAVTAEAPSDRRSATRGRTAGALVEREKEIETTKTMVEPGRIGIADLTTTPIAALAHTHALSRLRRSPSDRRPHRHARTCAISTCIP